MVKKNRNLALGTLLMALAGYAFGRLTAPKSGKETRKELHKKALKAKTEAEKTLKKMHSELAELIETSAKKSDNIKTKVSDDYKEALKKAAEIKTKAREALSAFHEGDADDKDLKRAVKEVESAIKHLKNYASKKN